MHNRFGIPEPGVGTCDESEAQDDYALQVSASEVLYYEFSAWLPVFPSWAIYHKPRSHHPDPQLAVHAEMLAIGAATR